MATISYEPTWTAVTASINFFGEEVGELQDFTLDENFNVQRISAIGSAVDIRHVPGVYQATLTARRAFVSADKLFTLMTTVDASKITGFTGELGESYTIADSTKLAQALAKTALGKGVLGVSINFDVEVKAKFVDNSSSEGEVKEQTIYTLHDCTINSRSTQITTANVIIFENVTIFPRSRTVGSGSIIEKLTTPQTE